MNVLIGFLLVYVTLFVLFFLLYKREYKKGRISAGMIIFQFTCFNIVVLCNLIGITQGMNNW